MDQAEKLIGSWPHARPPNPDAYARALADVLEQYPFGVVEECCNPLTGIARSREFPPTVACIVAWCDLAVGAYSNISSRPRPLPPRPPLTEQERAIGGRAIAKLGAWMRAGWQGAAPTWAEAAADVKAALPAPEVSFAGLLRHMPDEPQAKAAE